LDDCEKVLAMEDEVLTRYQKVSVGTCLQQVHCCDVLAYKYHMIKYNLYMQTKRYAPLNELFRKLAYHELQYEYSFDDQEFLFMIKAVLKMKPTLKNIKSLTDDQVSRIVNRADAVVFTDDSPLSRFRPAVALHSCANCSKVETAIAQYKRCPQCMKTFYCSKDCQKADWKAHKKACPQIAKS
jgi:hypothetical protein